MHRVDDESGLTEGGGVAKQRAILPKVITTTQLADSAQWYRAEYKLMINGGRQVEPH